jgi:segregation and condensation protein A
MTDGSKTAVFPRLPGAWVPRSPEAAPTGPSPASGGGLGKGRRPGRAARPPTAEQLVLDLDGYEGPIDLLLSLAREQKVDLAKISLVALADQYLAFIAARRELKLEIAADYLVMAAWLAYLKSRLLLPRADLDEIPEAEEIVAALGHRLRLLEAMQTAGLRLMASPQLGRDFLLRGAPEGLTAVPVPVWQVELYELLCAYGGVARRRSKTAVLAIAPSAYYSMDDALNRFAGFLGRVPEWRALVRFLPDDQRWDLMRRSALAATFAAALELARDGRLELRQDRAFGPIWVKSPPALRRAAGGAAI